MPLTNVAAVAHHEAGHALVALYYDVAFKYVTIEPTKTSGGHIRFPNKPPKSLDRLHRRGVVTMAGEAAQRRFAPRSVRSHHGEGDREHVTDFALDWCGGVLPVAEALVNLWDVQARELVDVYWPAVERIAGALLERNTLTRDECHSIWVK